MKGLNNPIAKKPLGGALSGGIKGLGGGIKGLGSGLNSSSSTGGIKGLGGGLGIKKPIIPVRQEEPP